MPDERRGLIDTSALVDLGAIDSDDLPDQIAISALSLAELAAGPHASSDPQEQARRQERLQWIEATFTALPFDEEAARAYGRIYATVAAGRKARGRRAVDLMIAATGLAAHIPLYTCNPADLRGLEKIVEIVALPRRNK